MADETDDGHGSEQKPPETSPSGKKRGKARIEVKVELDLDDLEVFDLRGDGIKTVTVVSN